MEAGSLGIDLSRGRVQRLGGCQCRMAGCKRRVDSSPLGLGEPSKKKRKVIFQDVSVFFFNRRQGFTCVPSQVCINQYLLVLVKLAVIIYTHHLCIVVISGCLFVCPIVTHEPLGRFALNLTRQNQQNVISLV